MSVEAASIPYASGSTIAPPLSGGSVAMLIFGAAGFVFMGGCFSLGLLMMFVLAPAANGLRSLEWSTGQRVLAGLLFLFVGICLVAAISFLAILVRRLGRLV